MSLFTEACSPACVLGIVLGGASALLCTALISYYMSSPGKKGRPQHVASPLQVLSRRERAEKVLEEMRVQRTGAAAGDEERGGVAARLAAVNRDNAKSSSDSSSWASTSDDDGEETEEDSEYERMEDLRLKMVFVVRHPVQPKMSAQEVAVLTASAGVLLVEEHQRTQSAASASTTTAGKRTSCASAALPVAFVPDQEDQQRWLQWYLWWNRIGCAKITLKCPERAAMDAALSMAAEMRLPVVQLHRSQFKSHEGVVMFDAVHDGADEAVVLAIGPAPSDVLEPVTGALKLFS